MEPNLGTRGVNAQSWNRDEAWRVYFNELRVKNPNASEYDLRQLTKELVLEDMIALDAIVAYAVRNALAWGSKHAEVSPPRGTYTPLTPEQKAEKTAAAAVATQRDVDTILQLNQYMPNGKRLRYCTGTEVAQWGGGYVKIGKKAGRKMVGEVFDEEGVRNLLGV